MHDDTTDTELVARGKTGDQQALSELVARHEGVAFRVALGILRDEEQAADAAQEAFIKALRALDRFRGDAAFRTWLLTIVANEARGALRKNNRRKEADLDDRTVLVDPGQGPDDAVLAAEQATVLRGFLAKLPEKQRLAVSLRVYDGLSFREVGALIGSSEGSARVNYHHGIRRLRELMST